MNNIIEAIADRKNHKIARQAFLRQLLNYEHWLLLRAGPEHTDQRLLFSSGEAMEEFDPLYSSEATQTLRGWEVFSGDLAGLMQVVIDPGSVFALLTFASMAFSLPMIADRDVDMVTACLSSIHAVMQNKVVLFYWAAIISVLTAIGFASFFLGLIVIMPWLAYAAWHAYCETLDASDWPKL